MGRVRRSPGLGKKQVAGWEGAQYRNSTGGEERGREGPPATLGAVRSKVVCMCAVSGRLQALDLNLYNKGERPGRKSSFEENVMLMILVRYGSLLSDKDM
jgi:hypothetical protein